MPSRGAGSVLMSKGTSDASTVLESSTDRSVANSTARSPSSDRRPAVLDLDTTAVPTSDPVVKGTSRPIGGPVPCEHIPVMTPNAMKPSNTRAGSRYSRFSTGHSAGPATPAATQAPTSVQPSGSAASSTGDTPAS